MDIYRLNRIRDICFNKSKSRGKKRHQQPFQTKSPINTIDKENDSFNLRNTSFDFRNQRSKLI